MAIFSVMFIAIVMGKWHRFIPALAGTALTIIVVLLIIQKTLLDAGFRDRDRHNGFPIGASANNKNRIVFWLPFSLAIGYHRGEPL